MTATNTSRRYIKKRCLAVNALTLSSCLQTIRRLSSILLLHDHNSRHCLSSPGQHGTTKYRSHSQGHCCTNFASTPSTSKVDIVDPSCNLGVLQSLRIVSFTNLACRNSAGSQLLLLSRRVTHCCRTIRVAAEDASWATSEPKIVGRDGKPRLKYSFARCTVRLRRKATVSPESAGATGLRHNPSNQPGRLAAGACLQRLQGPDGLSWPNQLTRNLPVGPRPLERCFVWPRVGGYNVQDRQVKPDGPRLAHR
ncbi:hypothetical protein BD289DRAFT_142180 [Coniella lustricola]|uniref:Uncharacterized protein n=1 Tax=Coniella lustricola TaxID=2025994 RepID=A0A2T2ZV92_9PEZI|nr:hypothetical protein BD289DRAFT_142180 [Coniella lustricola]